MSAWSRVARMPPPRWRNRLALSGGDPVPEIQREQPEFVERRAVERCEHRIAPVRPGFAVAGDHLEPYPGFLERSEVLPEQRETLDRPVIRPSRCGRLDQDVHRAFHIPPLEQRDVTPEIAAALLGKLVYLPQLVHKVRFFMRYWQ